MPRLAITATAVLGFGGGGGGGGGGAAPPADLDGPPGRVDSAPLIGPRVGQVTIMSWAWLVPDANPPDGGATVWAQFGIVGVPYPDPADALVAVRTEGECRVLSATVPPVCEPACTGIERCFPDGSCRSSNNFGGTGFCRKSMARGLSNSG